ncbi:hypothetical protein JHK84_047813 [Glycine max]|nr:hypothetical protein JHK85_048410 [Glycine max]KAG5102844.1 hypothetical protein JHK84_047813 [Glycine max]
MDDAGIKYIPSNAFSYYDQVLDTTTMLGAVPPRYNWNCGEIGFDVYFLMARRNAYVPAMEKTKCFDTNYRYIVPELGSDVKFSYASHKVVDEYKEAKVGVEKSFSLIDKILLVYREVMAELKAAGATWIQFDEPNLVKDLNAHQLQAFTHAYTALESSLSVFWSSTAQRLTKRPMKGMLIGLVTILNWSFVRDDQPRFETCYKDEVEDLEKASITVIQIDKATLREGFTNYGVEDTTQIHTHMCYSNFNDIIHPIIDMDVDADVITIHTHISLDLQLR